MTIAVDFDQTLVDTDVMHGKEEFGLPFRG